MLGKQYTLELTLIDLKRFLGIGSEMRSADESGRQSQ